MGDINYKIVYRPGSQNTVADLLSRLNEPPDGGRENRRKAREKQQQNSINIIAGAQEDEMIQLQGDDELCKRIKKYLEVELQLEKVYCYSYCFLSLINPTDHYALLSSLTH